MDGVMSMTPGEKLAALRSRKPRISQEELSRRLGGGHTRNIVANYENGRTQIPFDVARRIAQIWNTTPDWLYNERDEGPAPSVGDYRPGEIAPPPAPVPGTKRRYAVIGTAGASASPLPTDATGETVAFDDELSGNGDRFVIQARGRSMETRIPDGSYILVQPVRSRRQCPYGLLAVARNDEWEYIVKVLRSRGGEDWLDPLHPDYEPIRPGEGWEVVGYVVAIKHRRGPGRYNEEADTNGLGPEP